MLEIWKSLDRFPGYEVSNIGNVRSVDRICRAGPYPGVSLRKGRVLTQRLNNGVRTKYLTVQLPERPYLVHALVAEAFIGIKPAGLDTAHLNGISTDNRACNLAYVSRSENNRHITDQGKRKLTREQVAEIKAMKFSHGDKAALERRLNLAQGTVKGVLNGRLYAEA